MDSKHYMGFFKIALFVGVTIYAVSMLIYEFSFDIGKIIITSAGAIIIIVLAVSIPIITRLEELKQLSIKENDI